MITPIFLAMVAMGQAKDCIKDQVLHQVEVVLMGCPVLAGEAVVVAVTVGVGQG